MINYNQILEAVNRGINLALDDFDDDEQVQNVKSKQVNYRDYTKEYLDLLKYEVVDLGLPSGTLWCKYNLGIKLTKLSKAKNWYGNYYSWGELEPNKTDKDGKIYFDWDNYKFGNGCVLTKYYNNHKYGLNSFGDNLTKLLPEDDVVYQNKKFYNYKFNIPTKEQCEELINYTNNYWVKTYDPNKTIHNPEDDGGIKGLNGRVFEGKNGNQIFIPAAGYYDRSDIYDVGSYCYLWSSSLYLGCPSRAYYSYFDSDHIGMSASERYDGFSIRPVINL